MLLLSLMNLYSRKSAYSNCNLGEKRSVVWHEIFVSGVSHGHLVINSCSSNGQATLLKLVFLCLINSYRSIYLST